MNKGLTLFVAIVVMGTLLLISTGIVDLALKQAVVSGSGRDSQYAFYAADTGMECALFWDIKNPSASGSAFSTSTGSTIFCNRDANNPSNQWVVGGSSVSVINAITFLPEPFCAIVTVTKTGSITEVESRGYNSCNPSNPRRVERAVRAVY